MCVVCNYIYCMHVECNHVMCVVCMYALLYAVLWHGRTTLPNARVYTINQSINQSIIIVQYSDDLFGSKTVSQLWNRDKFKTELRILHYAHS